MRVLLLATTIRAIRIVANTFGRHAYRVTVPGWAPYCPVGAEGLYGCEAVYAGVCDGVA